MARIACVDIHRFLLQILLVRHQDWERLPCVVVTEDLPGGTILEANSPALHGGVAPGMRFAAALSLVPNLRGGAVSPLERERAEEQIRDALRRMSPDMEQFSQDPGVFWVGVHGMERVYGPPESWAAACRREVGRARFRCRIALGWTRAGTYGAVRSSDAAPVRIFDSREEELTALEQVPLSALPLEPRDRQHLTDLAVNTAGSFRALPPESVRRRFTARTAKMHRFLRDFRDLPVQAAVPAQDTTYHVSCPWPVRDRHKLTPFLTDLLERARTDLRTRAESIAAITVKLLLDDGEELSRMIRPARPTGDTPFIMKLLQLKLEEMQGDIQRWNGVVRCGIALETVPVAVTQGYLFSGLDRAGQSGPGESSFSRGSNRLAREAREQVGAALSLLRAHYGDDSVGYCVPGDSYLPEDYVLQTAPAPHDGGPAPQPQEAGEAGSLVRRIFTPPVPIQISRDSRTVQYLPSEQSDPWRDPRNNSFPAVRGTVVRRLGPYRISGGWWHTGYSREYYYLEMKDGTLLWAYRDARHGAWILQGAVE